MRILAVWSVLSLLQAVATLIDELIYHRRRGLRRWERVSHPIDAVFWGLALCWLRFVPPGPEASWIYLGWVILSSLLITKDEWVHARECGGAEQWLHASLFMLHPTLLTLGGAPGWGLWNVVHSEGSTGGLAQWVLSLQIVLAGGFAVYQVIYWRKIALEQV